MPSPNHSNHIILPFNAHPIHLLILKLEQYIKRNEFPKFHTHINYPTLWIKCQLSSLIFKYSWCIYVSVCLRLALDRAYSTL